MAGIHVLSSETINRIAAGEVVERPSGVVKELVENSIDAGAGAVTVEIQNGGLDLIRVTDNGCGIEAGEVQTAFLRHATSKICDAQDLNSLHSLGFRGEALSSIAAVANVEMITRTADALYAVRAVSSPGKETAAGGSDTTMPSIEITQVGAPQGTSVIVRDLFCSVPVRRRFLKSPQTEAGYITDLISSFALSHPDISFHFRKDGREKLHTTGDGDIRELIYRIYGKETARAVIECRSQDESGEMTFHGFLGRPELSRSTRNSEFFFVNGRIISSEVLSRGLEEGYRTDLMQHRFPFAMIWLDVPAQSIDVNIHPAKREARFTNARSVCDFLNESVHAALQREELIPRANLSTRAEEAAALKEQEKEREAAQSAQPHLEPFERSPESATVNPEWAALTKASKTPQSIYAEPVSPGLLREESAPYECQPRKSSLDGDDDFVFIDKKTSFAQQSLFPPAPVLPDEKTTGTADPSCANSPSPCDDDDSAGGVSHSAAGNTKDAVPAASFYSCSDEEHILTRENVHSFRYVGQLFGTYWIIEFNNKMLMIDQHAAHEKVNFERLMHRLEKQKGEPTASQLLSPPIIINLTGREESAYEQYEVYFHQMGYELEPFGERSFAIRAVPLELYANEPDELLLQTLDELADAKPCGTPSAILYKIAAMSCKAAMKGNTKISREEAEDLIEEMLRCENPYHCPHGRPTMIVMDQREIDRKFKRII